LYCFVCITERYFFDGIQFSRVYGEISLYVSK
jgi:hypothetical protein